MNAMDALLAAHRRAEDTVGSRTFAPLVTAQFEEVAALYNQARGPLADRIVKLLAEYAQFLAWIAQLRSGRVPPLSENGFCERILDRRGSGDS
ncbi:hypothetical protein ACFXJ6_07190 [Streptomyces sp. NPDC059218]|uniref:hypothetical protein n=1 Tax=unclassified Streptomyces TaxID=2593676 RepID=UPI00369E9BFC